MKIFLKAFVIIVLILCSHHQMAVAQPTETITKAEVVSLIREMESAFNNQDYWKLKTLIDKKAEITFTLNEGEKIVHTRDQLIDSLKNSWASAQEVKVLIKIELIEIGLTDNIARTQETTTQVFINENGSASVEISHEYNTYKKTGSVVKLIRSKSSSK